MKIDRTGWAPGPWDNEPDEVKVRLSNGMHGLIRRVPEIGHLCGYLDLPSGHPWSGKSYDAIDAKIHGGITYVADVGNGGMYRIGFDCAHHGDLSPGMTKYIFRSTLGESYKDVAYVQEQLEHLAKQAEQAEEK